MADVSEPRLPGLGIDHPAVDEVEMEKIQKQITRLNALDLLRNSPCPYCGVFGDFGLFEEINNNGLGIRCHACEKYHPFVKQKIMWLRGDDRRRSNDIEAVAKECGAYCYGCGLTFDELMRLGIGIHVHHTRPFADHGETYKKIPLCTDCHMAENLIQRMHQRLLQLVIRGAGDGNRRR